MGKRRASDLDMFIEGRVATASRSFTNEFHYLPVNMTELYNNMVAAGSAAHSEAHWGPHLHKVKQLLTNLKDRTEGSLGGASRGATEQVLHFASLTALADWTENNSLPWLQSVRRAVAEDNISYDGHARADGININFNRVKSVKEALALVRKGWTEGRERLAEQMYEFEQVFRREIQRPTWTASHTGQEVDVPSYLHGEPEHMIEYRPGQTNTKAISITVDINVRCSACGRRPHDAAPTPPHWLLFRGMAVAMLIQQLTKAGYAVTLRCITHTHYPAHGRFLSWPFQDRAGSNSNEWKKWEMFGGHFDSLDWGTARGYPQISDALFIRTVVVDILGPGMAMDLDNVIFALAHEGMIRKLEFALHEVLNVQPPFHRWEALTHRYSEGGSPRELNPSRVGDMMLGLSHLPPLVSVVDTGADIYLPSFPVMEDLTRSLNAPGPAGREAALARMATLYGGNLAYSSQAFDTLPAAATWTFHALKSVGVTFE